VDALRPAQDHVAGGLALLGIPAVRLLRWAVAGAHAGGAGLPGWGCLDRELLWMKKGAVRQAHD